VTSGTQEVLLATSSGMAIRFSEDSVRPMGLPASGVMGIKLDSETDGVVGMDLVAPGGFLWSITDNGLAKATPIDDYPLQNRYGQGVINLRLPKGASEVVAATLLTKGAGLIVTTSGGVTKRLGLSDTTIGGRSVRPQPALTLAAKARVTGVVLPAANGVGEKKTAAAPQAPAEAAKRTRSAVEKTVVEATMPAEPAQLELATVAPAKAKKPAPAAKKAAPATQKTTTSVEPPAQLELPMSQPVTPTKTRSKPTRTAATSEPAAKNGRSRSKATEPEPSPAPEPEKKRGKAKKTTTDA
jgi:hypothetical protein